jgi:hypothetical protein
MADLDQPVALGSAESEPARTQLAEKLALARREALEAWVAEEMELLELPVAVGNEGRAPVVTRVVKVLVVVAAVKLDFLVVLGLVPLVLVWTQGVGVQELAKTVELEAPDLGGLVLGVIRLVGPEAME